MQLLPGIKAWMPLVIMLCACQTAPLPPQEVVTESSDTFVQELENTSSLPDDLFERIHQTFDGPSTRAEVVSSLESLGRTNVGQDELRRAIVFLADGDYESFQNLRSTFLGDPRDLLREAKKKLPPGDYWFNRPFSELPLQIKSKSNE